jgi:hypothetical protein
MEAERRKRPEGWRNKPWMLTMNMHLHTHLSTTVNFCWNLRWLSSQNCPYLQTDPCRLFSLRLKCALKGRRYQMIEEKEENLLWDLCATPQNVFQNWKEHWKRCIDNGR